jgi:hypothetical protein
MNNKTIDITDLSQIDIEVKVTLALKELYQENSDLIDKTLPICMKLIANEDSGSVSLIRNLKVTKDGNIINFAFYKKPKPTMTIVVLLAFILALSSTTYFVYSYYERARRIDAIHDGPGRARDIIITYSDGATVSIKDIEPVDDLNTEETKVIRNFSIENNTRSEAIYSLNWTIRLNEFSDNLQYQVALLGPGGMISEWIPLPKETNSIGENIRLGSRQKHEYRIEVALKGDSLQNIDVGKEFLGFIEFDIKE